MKNRPSAMAWWVCGLAALFYLYEFVLQVSPSVMTQELMRDFNLDAAGLGAMAAFYYYSYTIMQIPAGMLYDRFGPRLLITVATLVCAAGAVFFAFTQTIALAALGRALMGIGSAFAFIGPLVLLSRWFPPQYFALMAGIVQSMSSVGAIGGQVPLAHMIHSMGWRHAFEILAYVGVVLAVVVWLVVRDRPTKTHDHSGAHADTKRDSVAQVWKNLKAIFGKTQTWWLGLYSFTSWAPATGFAALWGVPYLCKLYGITTGEASTICSFLWIGVGLGSPIIGWWSDKIELRCKPLELSALLGLISLALALYVPVPEWMMCILMLGIGLSASGQSLSFGLVRDINLPSTVGAAIGFNNMAVVLTGALLQPLVGWLVQVQWNHALDAHGVPDYAIADYRVGMTVLPICAFIGWYVARCKLHETHCRPLRG